MIEIKPIDLNNDEILEYLKNTKISENAFAVAAKDKDEVLGIGLFELYDDCAVVLDIATKEGFESLKFAIGKTVLNFIERREIMDVTSTNFDIEKTLLMLRFKFKENIFYLNLEGYFTQGC